MDQHANAFSVTVPERVAKVIGPGIMTGIMVPRAGRVTISITSRKRNDQTGPKRAPSPPLRTGKALSDWIRDKGFNGVSTNKQRERSGTAKGLDRVSLERKINPKKGSVNRKEES